MNINLLSVIVSLVVLIFQLFNHNQKGGEVIFLDVGQGDSMLYTIGNTQILIDVGGNDVTANKLGMYMPFWDKDIEYLILSHLHYDHFGGIESVMRSYNIHNIVMPTKLCRDTEFTKILNTFLKENDVNVLSGLDMKHGEAHLKAYSLTVYGCVTSQAEINNSSLIFEINVNDFTILNLGDLEKSAEMKVENHNVQILKVGHHCSDTSSSIDLLKRLKPNVAICSVGKNMYGHPSESVLRRFEALGIKYFLTKESGDIRVNIKRKVIYNGDNKIIYRL